MTDISGYETVEEALIKDQTELLMLLEGNGVILDARDYQLPNPKKRNPLTERLTALLKKSRLNTHNKDGSAALALLYGSKTPVEKEVSVHLSVFSIKRFRAGVCVVRLGY